MIWAAPCAALPASVDVPHKRKGNIKNKMSHESKITLSVTDPKQQHILENHRAANSKMSLREASNSEWGGKPRQFKEDSR